MMFADKLIRAVDTSEPQVWIEIELSMFLSMLNPGAPAIA